MFLVIRLLLKIYRLVWPHLTRKESAYILAKVKAKCVRYPFIARICESALSEEPEPSTPTYTSYEDWAFNHARATA